MLSLDHLGWNESFAAAFAPWVEHGFAPARVAVAHRELFRILAAEGEFLAEPAGRLRYGGELPVTGDWVVAQLLGEQDGAILHAVLPRTSSFSRRAAGTRTDEQVVASNIDTAFLVAGLDGDFNPRRLERYLAAARDGKVEPVVVLNKVDRCEDAERHVDEARRVCPGVPVHPISARLGSGLQALAPWLAPCRTVALLGSSGAGKSTLLNCLLGRSRQRTQEVREDDSRGRHTTTHRELVPLPGGALLVDTPGLRELALWVADDALDAAFADVAELSQTCRFTDCSHLDEPGCAVRAALDKGTLSADRFESYEKLRREQRHMALRQDARARLEEERRWKVLMKANKQHQRLRGRD